MFPHMEIREILWPCYMLLAAELLPGDVTALFSQACITAVEYCVVPLSSFSLCFCFSNLRVICGYFYLISLHHCDLAHFSAIHGDGRHVLVLLFTGSDVTINMTAHIVKYTPKGALHGNRKVSLSGGFVKCNII